MHTIACPPTTQPLTIHPPTNHQPTDPPPKNRADQVREAWEAGQRAGYDVLVMEALSSDPALCLARAEASKGYTLEQLVAAAARSEPAPPTLPTFDAAPLVEGGGADDHGLIREVEMEEDGAAAGPAAAAGAGEGGKQQQRQQEGEGGGGEADKGGGSRWGSLEEGEADEGGRRRKRGKWDDGDGEEEGGAAAGGKDADAVLLASIQDALKSLDDDGGAAAKGAASGVGGAGRLSAGSSGLPKGVLRKSTGQSDGRSKRVRWRDEGEGEEEEQGFRVGDGAAKQVRGVGWDAEVCVGLVRWACCVHQTSCPPRLRLQSHTSKPKPHSQLEQVFVLEGLGPPRDPDGPAAASSPRAGGGAAGGASSGGGPLSFKERARAEHATEFGAFRALLLGGLGKAPGAAKGH
jgi:hypothetical protein